MGGPESKSAKPAQGLLHLFTHSHHSTYPCAPAVSSVIANKRKTTLCVALRQDILLAIPLTALIAGAFGLGSHPEGRRSLCSSSTGMRLHINVITAPEASEDPPPSLRHPTRSHGSLTHPSTGKGPPVCFPASYHPNLPWPLAFPLVYTNIQALRALVIYPLHPPNTQSRVLYHRCPALSLYPCCSIRYSSRTTGTPICSAKNSIHYM